MGFRVPGHAVDGDGFRNHLMHWAASSTKSDENNLFFLPPEQWMSRSYICNPRLSLFFFILCVFKYRVHVLFYFPWRLNCCFFFIYKDVLKSHLEALKIFLAAARSRYIKSIHFTNENDWYTSKKLSASDNKTQLKSLSKSPLQEFHWKGRFLGNSGVGILGKGRIGDGECWLQKRSTMWELWAKFYLEQNKDYSLGDSISDSP